MNWDDVMFEKNYNASAAYFASKLANIYHCTELSRRLEGKLSKQTWKLCNLCLLNV